MRTLAAVAALAWLAAPACRAAEPKPAEDAPPAAEAEAPAPRKTVKIGPQSAKKSMRWFANWKKGLVASAVDLVRQKRSLTAVAAVRGAGQKLDDPSKPYLRGTPAQKAERKARKEREELAAAVDLILAGDIDGGRKGLDAFEAAHPDSAFLGDVKAARERLDALPKAAAGAPEGEAAPADEPPADQE